jgi:hypothetical protein
MDFFWLYKVMLRQKIHTGWGVKFQVLQKLGKAALIYSQYTREYRSKCGWWEPIHVSSTAGSTTWKKILASDKKVQRDPSEFCHSTLRGAGKRGECS